MNIFLAGEGVDELGDWVHHPSYRVGKDSPGILEALINRIGDDPVIVAARAWTQIRKYRAGDHRQAETRNVLGVALEASEEGCNVLVFARDRDGQPNREDDVERGIREAESQFPDLKIAGSTANQEIEAWILALLGERGSETHVDAKAVARSRGIERRQQKVDAVMAADMSRIPDDAASLTRWLGRVQRAL